MTHTLSRAVASGVATAAVVLATSGAAAADPACSDTVTGVLHAAHEATGDPAGVVHKAEETYCSVG